MLPSTCCLLLFYYKFLSLHLLSFGIGNEKYVAKTFYKFKCITYFTNLYEHFGGIDCKQRKFYKCSQQHVDKKINLIFFSKIQKRIVSNIIKYCQTYVPNASLNMLLVIVSL